MAGQKILVLGATGPAGICLLRELIYRQYYTIAYARNPSKIPDDLKSSPYLEVIKGDMTSTSNLSPAMAQTSVVISLLGPDIMQKGLDPKLFSNMYGSTVLPLMRQHGVRRIFAMTTLSIKLPEDHWTLIQTLVTNIMWLFLSSKYQTIHNIKDVFVNDAQDIDWTLFRLTGIPGGADEESWRKDRDQGKVFVGYISEKGWTTSIKRAALARWLVDAAEDGETRWIRKMPAISARA